MQITVVFSRSLSLFPSLSAFFLFLYICALMCSIVRLSRASCLAMEHVNVWDFHTLLPIRPVSPLALAPASLPSLSLTHLYCQRSAVKINQKNFCQQHFQLTISTFISQDILHKSFVLKMLLN